MIKRSAQKGENPRGIPLIKLLLPIPLDLRGIKASCPTQIASLQLRQMLIRILNGSAGVEFKPVSSLSIKKFNQNY